jgi:hypothetical protein
MESRVPGIVTKFCNSLQRDGVRETLIKVVNYPVVKLRSRDFQREVRFTRIYKNNSWRDEESVSGAGSTLKYTKNLRQELPSVLSDHSIRSLFDAPCGDLNWMKQFLSDFEITYVGGDIVQPLIESLNSQYSNERTSFIHIDLVKDGFPKADCMICRDCLFHLSYADTRSLLQNYVDSETSFLLTSTHTNAAHFSNRDLDLDIEAFRLIDLFSTPYNFPNDPLARIDDWIPPWPERQMCLWSRNQVIEALSRFGSTGLPHAQR